MKSRKTPPSQRPLGLLLSLALALSLVPAPALADAAAEPPEEVGQAAEPGAAADDEALSADDAGQPAGPEAAADDEALPADDGQAAEPEAAAPAEDPAAPAQDADTPDAALSTASIVEDGYYGTVYWTLDSEGTLTLGADGKGGTLALPEIGFYDWPGETKSVVTKSRIKLAEDSSNLFCNLTNLVSVDASNWDTSGVTNMYGMFANSQYLTSVNTSGWDTSNVTDMSFMFYYCWSLASLDVSGWDTSSVRSMDNMFFQGRRGCPLTSLDVSKWDVSNVTSMFGLFCGCTSLASLDLSGWDTSSVEFMNGMFDGCSSLASLDLSGFDTSSVTDMGGMFSGCSSLASLDLSGFDTSAVWKMSDMFYGCPSLASFKVGANYDTSLDGAVPDATASNGMWWSTKAKAWFTPEQIASGRSGVADTYANAEPVSFPDVPSTHWAYKVIMRGVELGLFKGRNDGTFGTNDNIKRCDVAVILWNMAGKPAAGSGAKSFSDVKSGAYYFKAVSWASAAGVVSGYSDGTFGPNDNVTREQLAAMLRSYYVKVAGKTAEGSADDFASMPDASEVAVWARPSVGFCFRNKILSGKAGKVAPKATATRAETAKMVVFLHDMLQE